MDNKNYQAQLARKSMLHIPSRIFVTLSLLHALISPVLYRTYLFPQSDAWSGWSISTVVSEYSRLLTQSQQEFVIKPLHK